MTRHLSVLFIVWVVLALFGACPSADAATGKEKDLGAHGAWHAYAYDEGGQTVCYMVTTKTIKASPSKSAKQRNSPYLMITHRPVEASTDVFSYGAGTALDAKHGARISVDQKSFDLFSVRDNAWARDARTDHKIAEAIRKAKFAQVAGIVAEGRMQTLNDKFDLTGASAAYKAIGKACGLPDPEAKNPEKRATSLLKPDKKTLAKPVQKTKPLRKNRTPEKTRSTHPKM